MRKSLGTVLVAAATLAFALALVPTAGAAGPVTLVVKSFDKTPIVASLFEPATASASSPVPVVFMTHGWGGSRETTLGTGFLASLVQHGYAVLTWDERGFGQSGGEAEVDAQEYEVRDAQRLIDAVARRPEILLDGPGDPRMGMVGGSYAGGIQLELAAADSRVDAIVPQIAWNDLPQALKPGGVLKLGWDLLLYAGGAASGLTGGIGAPEGMQTGVYAPELHEALAEATALNDWTASLYDWFDARGPEHYIAGSHLGARTLPGIHIPTLIQQGVSDTLFILNQGIANAEQIARNGATVHLIAFCGGHAANVSCSTKGAGDELNRRALAWLDRWVQGFDSVDIGSPVEYQTQDGAFHTVAAWPASAVAAHGNAVLVHQLAPSNPGSPGLGSVIASQADAAPTAARIPIKIAPGSTLLGIPRITYTYTGAGLEADVFAKLVDVASNGTALAVDDQAMPVKLTDLNPVTAHSASIDLAGVSWSMRAGHHLFLELTTQSSSFANSRLPSLVKLFADVRVPVIAPSGT